MFLPDAFARVGNVKTSLLVSSCHHEKKKANETTLGQIVTFNGQSKIFPQSRNRSVTFYFIIMFDI